MAPIIVSRIVEPITAYITPDIELSKAFSRANKLYLKHLPVVESSEDFTLKGLLDIDAVHRSLSAEVLAKQQEADTMQAVSGA